MTVKERVLVFECISGGGLAASDAGEAVPPTAADADLLAQGVAMRDALAADLQRLDHLAVSCAASRYAPLPATLTRVRPLYRAAHEGAADFLARQARRHDRVWVIAPESDGLLATLAAAVGNERWVGCTLAAIRLASSKTATRDLLAEHGIPVPASWRPGQPEPPPGSAWIVKPDDGAGCMATRLHADFEQARDDLQARLARGVASTLEEWIDGVALSLSLLCTDGRAELLGINRQRVVAAAGELLAYHGVELRAVGLDSPDGRELAGLAQRIVQAVPGLAGYVGVDLVWRAADGPSQPGGPVVIEINPRLTCAYVGLSAAVGRNLAGEILRTRHTEAAALPSDTARGDPAAPLIGWDVGGAHVKASLLVGGRVRDVAQWPAPLWQGLTHLDAAIDAARARWPMLDQARHGVTMTAEMTDLFPHREAGVAGLVDRLAARLGPDTRFFAGAADWPTASEASARWRDIASANWLATAHQVGARHRDALLVDIGSTTTDLIPVVDGQPRPQGRSDAARLASGELVYVGVVRTPLCALARQIAFGGRDRNVMNEFFATTADVFRLTGELDTAHDQHPTADGGDRSVAASCRRLARMIGMDARDAEPGDWLAFAARWREAMLTEIATHLARVARAAQMPADAPLVGAGCGLFLVRELAGRCGRPFVPFHTLADVDVSAAHHATWADTCAPSVAVALLLARWSQPCG